MKKYFARFLRAFEATLEAENIEEAATQARAILGQFPVGSVKLLSIKAEDYVEPPEEPKKPPMPPMGAPPSGPPSGTPEVAEAVITEAVAA